MRDWLADRGIKWIACAVVVAFFTLMVVNTVRAQHRCEAEGGVYVGRTLSCVHSPRPAPSPSAG